MLVKTIKKYFFQAIIIFILILSNKIIINFDHKNQILQSIYITIKNLNAKTQQF